MACVAAVSVALPHAFARDLVAVTAAMRTPIVEAGPECGLVRWGSDRLELATSRASAAATIAASLANNDLHLRVGHSCADRSAFEAPLAELASPSRSVESLRPSPATTRLDRLPTSADESAVADVADRRSASIATQEVLYLAKYNVLPSGGLQLDARVEARIEARIDSQVPPISSTRAIRIVASESELPHSGLLLALNSESPVGALEREGSAETLEVPVVTHSIPGPSVLSALAVVVLLRKSRFGGSSRRA